MILCENQIQNMVITKRLNILESELNEVRNDFDSILKEECFIIEEDATNKEMFSIFKADIKEYKTYFKTAMSAYRTKDFDEAIKYFKLASNVIKELDKKLRHLDFSANSSIIGNILGLFLLLGPYTIAQCFFFYNMDKAKNNIPLFVYGTQEEIDAKMKIINKEKAKYYGNCTASIIASLVSIVRGTKLIKTNVSKRFYGKPNMVRNILVSYLTDIKNVSDDYIKLCKEHKENK